MMKKRLIPIAALAILVVVLASVALVSAAPSPATRVAQSPSDLEGVRWLLVSYQDKAGDLADALADAPATAEFAAGKVAGSAGCNNYTAAYEVKGDSMTIGQAASTMMMCPAPIMEQETAFLAHLQAVAQYAIDGGQLTLFDDLGAPLLVFNAEQPATLVGSWLMTAYNNGKGGFQSGLADVDVTAVFDAEGKLTGNAGCNTYSASYKVDGDKIDIGPAITTRMACAPDVMTQEAAYLKALEAATVFALQGNELVLRDDKGAAQVGYMADKAATTAPTLAGTSWKMTAYNNGRGGVQSALPDVEVTATFGEDGRISGNAGCNTYSAPFEVDGNKIKVGPGMSTMMACEDKINQQETAYLNALNKAATWEIKGTELVLRDAAGAVQVRYEALTVAQAPEAPATTAPVAVPETAGKIPGIYLTLRPAASAGVQTIVLALVDGGKAEFTQDFGKDAPVVETGTWVENADGTITVTLTDQGGKKLAKPQTMKFQRDGTYLTLVDYDKAMWGESGLKLNLAADVARKARSAMLTLDLSNGFALDPTFVSVNGGGEVDAGLLSAKCKGYINRQPVATVRYPGGAKQVRTFFYSDGDPTLLVLTPDGKVLCNDNASEQILDPFLALDNPIAGDYRIWVGSAAKNQLIPGVLVFSANESVDLGSFQLGSLIKRPSIPQTTAAPSEPAAASPQLKAFRDKLVQNAPSLRPGFKPVTVEVTAEGIIPLFRLPEAQNKGCGGLVTGAPSYAFKWSGETPNLNVSFEGDGDSTLMVVGVGNKLVLCNDDAVQGNPNPAIDIENPQEDIYLVYVGRLNPEKPVTGTLTVTEAAKGVTQ